MNNIILKEATTDQDFNHGKLLFKAYADSLNIDLEFQDFNNELSTIKEHYFKPFGVLFLLYDSNTKKPLGCCAVRKFKDEICELKRMYLREEIRGHGYAKLMLDKSIEFAKKQGYIKMRLDTLPHMKSAIKIYESVGFYEIEAYRFNPFEGAKYMELKLTN